MYNILAGDVINEEDALFRIDAGGCQSLKEGKVNVFLLLSFEHVHQGLRGIAAMPAASNADHAGYVA